MSSKHNRKVRGLTMNPVEAGKVYFNMGRDKSRRAAKTGEMPCVKIGDKYFASIPAIEAMISNAGKTEPEDTT